MKLNIEFLSDWHVGDGAGASGHIDRVVRRHPEDNLPYVPAKTLTGILRDACEKVARGLDEGNEDGPWQQFVARLFGQQSQGTSNVATTTAALMRIGPARFSPALRQMLKDNPELAAALTFVKPGAALDQNGVAKSKMLRMEEMVIAGAALEAEVEWDVDAELQAPAQAILAAGAKAVERLGAKRRRGNGRCKLELDGATPDFNSIFSDHPPILQGSGLGPLRLDSSVTLGQASGWHVLNLDLVLLSHVAIPADTAGNVIATHDHIPGTLLLPALDRKLRKLLGEHKAMELTSHLAAGRIQIRNAYPCRAGQRLLPVPSALMAEKEAPNKITNELHGHEDDGVQRKQLRTGYLPAEFMPDSDGKSPVVSVTTITNTHAVIEDQYQRPTEAVGGVYTYEAIAPGQHFRAELWISKTALETLPDTSVLNGPLRIGRAKKDDYGQVNATVSIGGDRHIASGVSEFTLWLTSPLLIRDERLRPIITGKAFSEWLKKQPGLEDIVLSASFVRSVRIDGWNNAWKEPRPTRFGLAAGSCFRFNAHDPNLAETLGHLQLAGLGERRGEGYGEIRINAPLLDKEPASKQWDAESNQPDKVDQMLPVQFIHQLHLRAWRTAIRRQALAKASEYSKGLDWKKDEPTNAQLGTFRSMIESWQGKDQINAWLRPPGLSPAQQGKRHDRFSNKWPRKSIEAFEKMSRNELDVWERIETTMLPIAGVNEERLKKDMANEATRILWLTVIGAELDRRAKEK